MRNIINWFIATRFMLQQSLLKLVYTDLKKPAAIILVYSGMVLRALGFKKGLDLILKGRRVDEVSRADTIIRKVIQQGEIDNSEFVELFCYNPLASKALDFYQGRFLILKIPVIRDNGVMEKGAIVFKFSPTFIAMYNYMDIGLLAKYFRIIFEPSSSGYAAEEILVWTTLKSEKIVVQAPEKVDYMFLSRLDKNLIPVRLGAADWVNSNVFHKIDGVSKEFDVVYVASFNPVKRVDRYIRALVRINRKRKDFRAALVCAPPGFSRRETMATLDWARNRANIEFFDGMPQSDLNVLLNQSKVNVLLSLKEGANKALSEGMFAGTPAILLEENIGVNRASINEQTGRIMPDAKLEEALVWFSDNYEGYRPEIWANENISPVASTNKLARTLEEIETREGRNWTGGLYPKVNQPELAYLESKNDWLYTKRMELLTVFSKGADESRIIAFLEQLQRGSD